MLGLLFDNPSLIDLILRPGTKGEMVTISLLLRPLMAGISVLLRARVDGISLLHRVRAGLIEMLGASLILLVGPENSCFRYQPFLT